MSKIEDSVCEKIKQRAAIGKAKYGVTMERGDLFLVDWLTHLQEELMDATVYVERLLTDVVKYVEEKETWEKKRDTHTTYAKHDGIRKPWTDEEAEKIVEWLEDGIKYREIALRLDRTYASVYALGTVAVERVKLGKHPLPPSRSERATGWHMSLEEYNAIEVLIKQGMPHAEIAARFDRPISTIKRILRGEKSKLQLEQEQEGVKE